MERYGERLKAARKMNGLTQTELAEKIGITQKSYQRMEAGNHDLKMSTIQQLCEALNISADWLIGIETKHTHIIMTGAYGAGKSNTIRKLLSEIKEEYPNESNEEIAKEIKKQLDTME